MKTTPKTQTPLSFWLLSLARPYAMAYNRLMVKILIWGLGFLVGLSTFELEANEFWWGVSTSSYQNEESPTDKAGYNYFETDWDKFHQAGRTWTAKGKGTSSYSQMERDISALKELGVSHYRFGVEWARVEPRKGTFNQDAIEHYVYFARRLVEEGITPIVCYWHFTFPSWLTNLWAPWHHGWLHPELELHWTAYVRKMTEALSPYVDYYAPQNEPNSHALLGYVAGTWPPGGVLLFNLYDRVTQYAAINFVRASRIIKQIKPRAKVMSIQNIVVWEKDILDFLKINYNFAQKFNYWHLDEIQNDIDIVGFNYYFKEVASPLAPLFQWLRKGSDVSDLGWRIFPEGISQISEILYARYGQKPLVLTENGIADGSDLKRQKYLKAHVDVIGKVKDRFNILGYFHWTLIDNFEWNHGYKPKFGLYSMDSRTLELRAKPSVRLFQDVVRGNNLHLNLD